jgi:hypothetical protein
MRPLILAAVITSALCAGARAVAADPLVPPASADIWWRSLDVGAIVVTAPGAESGAMPLTGGGVARLRVGQGALGAALGVAGPAPMTLTLAQGHAQVTRVPLDLDALAAWDLGRHELLTEVGVSLAVMTVAGSGYGADRSSTRVEVGVREAVTLRWWRWRRLALFVGAEVVAVPRPYELARVNGSSLGRTPVVWAQLTLGAAVIRDGRF